MLFNTPLREGILLKRYKRFLADVKLSETGEIILAHVPNSGSMMGVKDPGSPCRVSVSNNPSRKIPYTLEMVKPPSAGWVGVNTSLTNKLVAEAFEAGLIEAWKNYSDLKAEVKISKETRLDFMLSHGAKAGDSVSKSRLTKTPALVYVEVKNVSMAQPPCAVFPDAVTERGQKHLRELIKLKKKGHGAEIMFVIQREDCHVFKPCDEIDPEYGKLLRQAAENDVTIRAWSCRIDERSIELATELPIDLS